ncbi:hypothetical protein [Streptomyces sp. NPDC054865]
MKPLIAPAAALRADRRPDHPTAVVDDVGVRYAGGERRHQVDQDFGVLVERWSGPATGIPQYGVLDPEVQRKAADRRLCAHCLDSPEREPSGAGGLWLLRGDAAQCVWPADIRTTTPPICREHAELALERCATLRGGYLAVRVPEVEPVGVIGTLYDKGGPVSADELVLFTDAERLRFVLARYLVLELRGAVLDQTLTGTRDVSRAAQRDGAT